MNPIACLLALSFLSCGGEREKPCIIDNSGAHPMTTTVDAAHGDSTDFCLDTGFVTARRYDSAGRICSAVPYGYHVRRWPPQKPSWCPS